MKAIDDVVVEINPLFYQRMVEGALELHNPYRGGNHNDTLPKHGIVLSSPDDSLKEGQTVFFLHFNLLYLNPKGRAVINIRKEDIYGYADRFPDTYDLKKISKVRVNPYGDWLCGARVESEQGKAVRKYAIKNGLKITGTTQYCDQLFRVVTRGDSEIGVRVNDLVMVWRDSDMPIDYLSTVFIKKEYITYNKTQSRMHNNFFMVRKVADPSEWIEKNGILSREGDRIAQNTAVVMKGNDNHKNIMEGDTVMHLRTRGQFTPISPTVLCIRYTHIQGII